MNIDDFNNQYNAGRRDFSFENFEKIDLAWKQNLTDCNFEGCNLRYGNFGATNFANSNFKNANLEFSNLSGANLSFANLQGANLEGANLSRTILAGVQYSDTTQFPQGITPEIIQNQTKSLEHITLKKPEFLPSLAPSIPPPLNISHADIQAKSQEAKKTLEEALRLHAEANRLKKEAENAKQELRVAQNKIKQAMQTKREDNSNSETSLFSQLKSTAEGISNFDPEALFNQVQSGVEKTVQQVKQTALDLLESQSTASPHPPPLSENTSSMPAIESDHSELQSLLPLPPPFKKSLQSDSLAIQNNPTQNKAKSPRAVENFFFQWKKVSAFKVNNHTKLAISPDSQLLAIGKNDSSLQLWKIAPSFSTLDYMFIGQKMGIYAIAFSPDQKLIASGAGDGKVTIWDVKTKKLYQTLALSTHVEDADSHNKKLFQALNPNVFVLSNAIAVSAIAFSAQGDRLVVGYADGTLRKWDIRNARLLKEAKIHTAPILKIKYSANEQRMLTGSMDQTIKVMIPESWSVCHSYQYDSSWPSDFIITPDSQLLIAGLNNGDIHAWNLATDTLQYKIKSAQKHGLMNLHLLTNESILVSVSHDNSLTFLNLPTGEKLSSQLGSYPSCLSPDQKLLAITTNNNEIKIMKNIP